MGIGNNQRYLFLKVRSSMLPLLVVPFSQIMNDYVVLKNLEMPSGQQTLQGAIEWLEQAIDVASRGIQELSTTDAEDWTEEKKKELYDIYKVIDEIIMRLYFEVAHEKNQSDEPVEKISDELRCRFYEKVQASDETSHRLC